MKRHRFPALLLLAAVTATIAPVLADEKKPTASEMKIPPPFGLHWGEEAERLEKLLAGAKATIAKRTKNGEAEIWEVEGLVQKGLHLVIFKLEKGVLTSLSLVYDKRETPEQLLEFYGEVKGRIEKMYGQPTRESTEAPPEPANEEDNSLKVREAQWKRDDTGLRLVCLRGKGDAPTHTMKVEYSGTPAEANP